MSNVKLAIRVRPFTERELKSQKDHVSVVNVVDEHTVTITNIKVSVSGAGDSRERVRRYSADYTFDSACAVTEPAYASQEKVFESIGREVIASVSRGSSACVLAYGQSATGKTHTMMGTETQPGLVPRLCTALAENSLDVTVSFLEIYNERVHDLLAGEVRAAFHSLPRRTGNSRKDLRVREHPSKGPYVQNLRRVAVRDVETLLALVQEGARRRHTAATRRNSTSSRSHALLELATPRATLHLADLAGSEKASWEGCGGGRQKEGANINKSLVALSNVISALVSGASRGRFVPYRDSALTWLLRDCFVGGAATFIIATVSPSVACYGESASTLRWAARARQLRTPRTQVAGPITATKAALQAQLNQLLAELTKHHIRYVTETGQIIFEDKHWKLPCKNKNAHNLKSEAKIGNLITMLNPKTEPHNSESTASSVASGSSDTINTMDKIPLDIKEEINKEVDKLFGPALERTRSGSDLGAVAPFRHKRKQYKSQELLPIDKSLQIHSEDIEKPLPSQSHDRISSIESLNDKKLSVPILYDNQRAEIVASVTERLYSKLKKKDEAAVPKLETAVDRKIVEPLSELRICTNARQRLMEISQKTMRNRRRIGIPAHTQTRMTAIRVRDQGIDIQTDLETYILRKDSSLVLQKDVTTQTMPMTPRCKEANVGPKCGSLNYKDSGTVTEHKNIICKNSLVMTDYVPKCDRCSQTHIVPPPRRKKQSSTFSKYIHNNDSPIDYTFPSLISINISQQYPIDSESQSSDENSDNKNMPTNVTITPDLLTNHNAIDSSINEVDSDHTTDCDACNPTDIVSTADIGEKLSEPTVKDNDFPDTDNCSLPRVKVDPSTNVTPEDMKDIILGRNENTFPYNIVLSPSRERENIKRIVKFQDPTTMPLLSVASQTIWETDIDNCKTNLSSDITNSEREYCNNSNKGSHDESCSDSTDSSKADTDSFIWKSYKRNQNEKIISRDSAYKSNLKGKAAKSKMYKQFLGLDKEKIDDIPFSSRKMKDITSSDSTENDRARIKFRQRRQFFEEKFKISANPGDSYSWSEREILDSCNSLDTAVNKYEEYLSRYNANRNVGFRRGSVGRTPTEYLQHLIKLRRELIMEGDVSDSTTGLSRK